MTDRRLPLLALLVAGLVAIVALVAHGRPLAGNAGHGGVSASFWSYALTTTIILIAISALVLLATVFTVRMNWTTPQASLSRSLMRTLISLMILGAVVAYIMRHHRPLHLKPNPTSGGTNLHPPVDRGGAGGHGTHIIWLEVMIVFGLLAVAAAIVTERRRRKRTNAPELYTMPDAAAVAPGAVAEALDESLDDLRSDPDLRRAIVAAYARMEHALRSAGLPRRPAEAPLEYVERALHTLDTSGPSVRRLTDLFEWAKFSHHEPEPSMRDDAVEALEAVRDELRAPVEVHA